MRAVGREKKVGSEQFRKNPFCCSLPTAYCSLLLLTAYCSLSSPFLKLLKR